MKLSTVALVGRPNVGKSTLFNKIAGKKISIIEDTPGVTRDRIYAQVVYGNYKFNLIDTGGIDLENGTFTNEIKMQAEIAINDADVVIFIVDGKDGLTSNDFLVRDMLMKSRKRVIVAVNKMDTKEARNNIYDFYELGFEEYIPISGHHNIGYIDLMDSIVSDFNEKEIEEEDDRLKFCVIGRPNVGKSSLINALLNEERVIVSPVAGTTRDSVDTPFMYNKEEVVAIDTAGMRKKGKIYETIEKYSLIRSLRSIDRSDVCLLVLNAEEGIIEHDKHIASYAIDAGKGLILVVNKWDTIDDTTTKEYIKLLRSEFQFTPYAPILFVSALNKSKIHTIMPEIVRVFENCKKEMKTSVLNDVIIDAYTLNLPPSYKTKRLKIYYATQTGSKPPKITMFVNSKNLVHFSYERYLENKIRESFDLEGTPIILQFKNRGE